jgi:hypothetical protein
LQFSDAYLDLAAHDPVQSDPVWHFICEFNDLTYLSSKFKGKTSSCIQVNTVIENKDKYLIYWYRKQEEMDIT